MILEKSEEIVRSIGKVLIGKEDVIKKVLMAVYAKGNRYNPSGDVVQKVENKKSHAASHSPTAPSFRQPRVIPSKASTVTIRGAGKSCT